MTSDQQHWRYAILQMALSRQRSAVVQFPSNAIDWVGGRPIRVLLFPFKCFWQVLYKRGGRVAKCSKKTVSVWPPSSFLLPCFSSLQKDSMLYLWIALIKECLFRSDPHLFRSDPQGVVQDHVKTTLVIGDLVSLLFWPPPMSVSTTGSACVYLRISHATGKFVSPWPVSSSLCIWWCYLIGRPQNVCSTAAPHVVCLPSKVQGRDFFRSRLWWKISPSSPIFFIFHETQARIFCPL